MLLASVLEKKGAFFIYLAYTDLVVSEWVGVRLVCAGLLCARAWLLLHTVHAGTLFYFAFLVFVRRA